MQNFNSQNRVTRLKANKHAVKIIGYDNLRTFSTLLYIYVHPLKCRKIEIVD